MLHALRQWLALPERTRRLIARNPDLLIAFQCWHRAHTDNLKEYGMTAPQTNVLTQLVQAVLPRSLYPKAKAVVATVTALGSAVLLLLPYFTDVPTQVGGIIGTVLALLAPVSVYLTSNEDAHDPEHDGEPIATD